MYVYNTNTNINADVCWTNFRDHENAEIKDYILYNNFSSRDDEIYGSMPPIYYVDTNLRGRPGYGLSDDYLIDTYSALRINPNSLTKDRCHIQLEERVFHANPKLTGAKGDIEAELNILTGSDSKSLLDINNSTDLNELSQAADNINKHTNIATNDPNLQCNKIIMEKNISYMMPLLECVKDIQNANHIIPEWTRGGDDTRSYTNKVKYSKCNYN